MSHGEFIGAFTAKEAADRWCPLVRVVDMSFANASTMVATNRCFDSAAQHRDAPCLGPKCAFWRPLDIPRRRLRMHEGRHDQVEQPPRPDNVSASWTWSGFDPGEGDPPCWVEPLEDAAARVRGYCGAGGPLSWMAHES